MEHQLLARRPLPLGALICGIDLAACERGAASLFYHSPNVVQTLPLLPIASSSSFLRGHYSWDPMDLLTHRLEGLIFPSVLLVNRALRTSDLVPNIVLHFLGNGVTCGEVIRPIAKGEALLRHWNLGGFKWRHIRLTRGWSAQDGSTQAKLIYDLVKPSNQYHLDCIAHDADDTRPAGTPWYRADTFEALVLLHFAFYEGIARFRSEERERYLMSACDVNVRVNVVAFE